MPLPKYTPAPGYYLIDPLDNDKGKPTQSEHSKKTDYIAIQDSVDKQYKGHIVAVGESIMTDFGFHIDPEFKVGDLVLYSIAGCEETKLLYNDDFRYRMILAPFRRVLLQIND